MISRLLLTSVLLVMIGTASSVPVPVNFAAGQSGKWSLGISASGDHAGGFSENYCDAEHLLVNTHIFVKSGPETGYLEANVDSDIIGQARIGWISADFDPASGKNGRPYVNGQSVEELTGVFSIEKYVQLGNNSSQDETNLDWLM